MAKHKRKIRNYLINPKFQLKFSFYFLVSALAMVGVLIALAYYRLQLLNQNIQGSDFFKSQVENYVAQSLIEIVNMSLFSLLGFAAIIFVYSIIITHRVAGPAIAICYFIDDLKNGKYGEKKNLRKYDELKPIMDKLNELSEDLNQKFGPTSKS